MMDTVLNLGLNDVTMQAIIAQTGNERFAYDAYRRFIQMFGRIVMGIEAKKWDAILTRRKNKRERNWILTSMPTNMQAGRRAVQGIGTENRTGRRISSGPLQATRTRHQSRIRLVDGTPRD